MNNSIDHKQYIENLLMQGELEEAITEFMRGTQANGQSRLYNDLILQSSQYYSNKRDFDGHILDARDFGRVKARITYSVREYLKKYEPTISAPVQPTSTSSNVQQTHHGTGDNIGGDKTVNINIHKGTPVTQVPVTTKKDKILFLAANPTNEARLQTDHEYRLIQQELKLGNQSDKYEFLQPRLSVTVETLLRAIDEHPQIVHFSGHGQEDGIIISKDDNTAHVLGTRAIKRLFKKLKGQTRIVLLNNCYSASQAEVISKFGMYVVGYNLPIGDKAAISFARGLYIGLGQGDSFEDAYDDAMFVLEAKAEEYADSVEVWKDGKKLDL